MQDNLADVVQLADKYALVHVLHKVQCWVVMSAPTAPTNAFPHLVDAAAALRVLRLRETMIRCGLGDADGALEELNVQDLRPPAPTTPWQHYSTRTCMMCHGFQRNVNHNNVCQSCFDQRSPEPPPDRQAISTALKRYTRGGVHDWQAASKVLASIAHILATGSTL